MTIILTVIQLILRAIFLLPPPTALFLMYFWAEIIYKISLLTPLQSIVASNISLFFPEADGKLLARKLLRNFSYSIFELLCFPFFDESHLQIMVKCQNLENVDWALAERKGAIIASMHTGNYEIIPVFLFQHGYKFNSILKSPSSPLFRLINKSRRYRGINLINVLEEDMYRSAVKALNRNEIVGILIDTAALESRYQILSFLGHNVPAATGWLTLAQRTQAPVIPTISWREGKKIVITFGEPLVVSNTNRNEVISKIKTFFENFIKAHPEQWGMFLNAYETKRVLAGK